MTSSSKQKRTKTQNTETQKTSFLKRIQSAENADLYKSVMNKIMTTHK